MKVFLQKLFNVYPGEEKNAFLFASLGFLWSFAVTAGLKFADALFLLHVGPEHLPTVYTLTACGMLILATFLIYAFHSIPVYRIFLTVLSLGIVFYSFVFFCLTNDIGVHSWLWYSLKIYGSLFFTVAVTCYWTFIDQYHHLQDAKRLYGLFSSMIFLGVAMTGTIMRSGVIDFRNLCLIIIAVLLLTIYWIFRIIRKTTPVHDENEDGGVDQSNISWKEIIKGILSSRFTLLLMAGNLITYLLLVITEFNYLSAFDKHFDPGIAVATGNEENAALTQVLGQWLAVVSVSNLIFGLFFYSRLVRRFGIGSMLMVTPTILLFTFMGWSINDSLLFPILGLFVVEGTLYVIDDSNFNLLLNAVPSKLKYKIRVTIESFFEPIGMLTSSLLLSVTWIDSKTLGLILAGISLCVALILKANYLKAIYQNLSQNAIHFQKMVLDWFKLMTNKEQKTSEYRLLGILKNGKEASKNFAVQGLLGFEDKSILEKLLNQADHLSTQGKIQFIEQLSDSCFALDTQVLDHLHMWAYDENEPELKSTIDFYLACKGLLHPEKAIGYLKSSDLNLKGAAIISLEKSWAHLSPTTAVMNWTLASQNLRQLLESSDENEICMGLKILGVDANPQDVEILLPYLKNPSINVARTAAASIARIADKKCLRHAPVLIDRMTSSSDNELRLSCLKALGKIEDTTLVRDIIGSSVHFRPNERRLTEEIICKIGLRTVPTLLAMTKDTTLHDKCRVLAGRILGRLALPQLRANLYDILSKEIERAYFYFYHYHTIQQQYPNIDLKELQDALLTGFHSVLDFIIQLLGTAGELEDCELLSRSIRSNNPKIRSQVVEALEKTCETRIFRLLQPLVIDMPSSERIQSYVQEEKPQLSLIELLDKMSYSSSQVDQIIAASLKHRLKLPNWRETIRQQMSGNEEIFHNFGYELLDT